MQNVPLLFKIAMEAMFYTCSILTTLKVLLYVGTNFHVLGKKYSDS